MQIILPSNSLLYIILVLLYMDLCRSVRLDRSFQDQVDAINLNNCDGITGSYMEGGRCRCSLSPTTVVSRGTGEIECIRDYFIDPLSKYSLILHSIQYVFYKKIRYTYKFKFKIPLPYFFHDRVAYYRVMP